MSAPSHENDLRRMVEEATRAARAAEEAAARLEREQPSRFERIVDAIAKLVQTLVEALFGRLRAEIDHARRSGEELVARVLHALSRTLAHVGRALLFGFLALVLATLGLVVLTIAAVVALNGWLGDPLGTLVAAGALLVLALAMGLAARGRTRAIAAEAEALAPGRR